ncbi:AraC family transcriptional regulator [Cupriavidus basilensis]|uniref:AraC family transcriptional regulator n=1 Tax=unclassified Cupriavidus TaxID=2640874 RepID=UPI000452B98B|nr:AraC family transcriptional regulator [Cupriavidus sp. SK-3]KDP84240.1 AraC family transcriptional regulator [Cupriavidus sp. SK-3]
MSYQLRSASLTNYEEVARSLGLNPQALLRAAGISLTALINPDMHISAVAVSRLLEASARAAGVEDFGLRMAETRELANLGPLAFVMREEPTLRRALDSMARYLRLHNEAIATRIEDLDDLVVIRQIALIGAAGNSRQSAELIVGVLYRVLARFLGDKWKPRSICFTHAAPASTATHQRVFGMPVQFNQEFDGLICQASDLDAPLPSYDVAMARQVRQYLDTMLVQSNATTADKVRNLVLVLLPSGGCTIERVAEHLGMDARTVQRRLAARGESYSAILHGVRKELAMRYIENRERPLSEVAMLLGFGSLSAFSRWFAGQFTVSASRLRDSEAERSDEPSS